MKHVFLTIFIWLQLSAVSAAPVFYDDLAKFQQYTNTSLTDFDSFLGGNAVTNPAFEETIDGNVYSNSGNLSGVQICSAGTCGGIDSAVIYAAGMGGTLRIELADHVSAVGGIFGELEGSKGGSGQLSLWDYDNNMFDLMVNYGVMDNDQDKTFFGWTSSDTRFSALEFKIVTGGTPYMFAALDDLRFGSSLYAGNGVYAVPLPGTLWLFLTAMSGLLGLNRLRRS